MFVITSRIVLQIHREDTGDPEGIHVIISGTRMAIIQE